MNPDLGPRCGECRMGLGVHNLDDPLCEVRPKRRGTYDLDRDAMAANSWRPLPRHHRDFAPLPMRGC